MSAAAPQSSSWICVASVSIAVSVLVQILWPLLLQNLLSPQFFCNLACVPNAVKQSRYCELLRRRALTVQTTGIGYFVDPLYTTSWLEDDDFSDRKFISVYEDTKRVHKTGDFEAEAVAALSAAVNSRKKGNLKKAETIIQHALALAPTHPDILTEYGLVAEINRNNVVEAERFYTKALSYNPNHAEALTQRARTLPVVEKIDKEMLKNLHLKCAFFRRIPRTNAALRKAMRESYFLHVYHTVALEGNTMSIGQTRSILETRMAVAGKSILEHNEILGMDAALRFINQSVVHLGYFTLKDVLDIHRHVLGFVDPEMAGVLRKTQVFVGSFIPVAADLVLAEMEELVRWLNDQESKLLDPVERAAIAHYKLVSIHPFIDGNGRTARLLMNLILMQVGFPPVIIPVEARAEYYDTLNSANYGDLRPFIRFIARQTDDTLTLYINSASTCPYHEASDECKVSIGHEISIEGKESENNDPITN